MARILLNEADPDVRRLLDLLLRRLGHEVIVSRAGRPPTDVDLMVLEPASDACLEEARAARDLQPALPILAVSVLPEEASYLTLGPIAYLAKPFAIDDLRRTVDAVLLRAGVSELDPCPGG